MSKEFNDALAKLHSRTVDAKVGFDEMVKRAEPEFKPIAIRFRDLHAQHALEIAALLPADADKDGSFMSTVNKAVVTMRDVLDDIDDDVMDQVRSGEKWVQSAFDDAIKVAPESVRPALFSAQSQLNELLNETRHLD